MMPFARGFCAARPKSGVVDPYFANVVLLMHMDGADGSTTFTDQKGHSFSAGNHAHIETDQSKFGGASLGLDGTDDYIYTANSTDWVFGTGDFTLEAFIYPTSNTGSRTIFGRWSNPYSFVFYIEALTLKFATASGVSVRIATAGANVTLNQWNHVAASFVGGILYLYINGTRYAPAAGTYYTTIQAAAVNLVIGASMAAGQYFPGYIDEVRITKGVGRYTTATITVPTAAFPNA